MPETPVDLSTDLQAQLDASLRKSAQLETALKSSRIIGIAVGIVVERFKVSTDQAFDILVRLSQNEHRKLRDVADSLARTGEIRPPGTG